MPRRSEDQDARDAALFARAAGQHALFTTQQAIDRGWSRQRLHRWTGHGRLRRVHRGIYALVGAPATWEQHVMAAVLACGPAAAASHRTAMALHGIRPARRLPETSIDVSVPAHRDPWYAGITVHRVILPAADVTAIDGIPCTTYERTLLDSAATLGLGQLARGLDQGLVSNRVTLASVHGTISALRPAPGRRRARLAYLAHERAPESERSESAPEIRVLTAIRTAGIPIPEPQYWVTVDGEHFRFDAAYPEHRIGIEYQGWDSHRSRSAFDADYRRDRLLTLAGWSILYFTSASSDAEIVHAIQRLRGSSPQS